MMLNTVSTQESPVFPNETELRAKDLDMLVHQYKKYTATIRAMEQDRENVIADIRERIGYFGGQFQGTHGIIAWKEGCTTTTYNKDTINVVIAALETLAPALAAQLKSAVKERKGEPVLTIR
jgi:hypothetical protein